MTAPTLRTERLLLRPWRDADLDPFAALNADPQVMKYFPRTLSRAESNAFVKRITEQFDEAGWGLWAVDVTDGQGFIGFVGLWPADFLQPGTVEVGWRLAAGSWGRGYAPEAATMALRFGFEQFSMPEVVSFTSRGNTASQRVMEKIGLRRQPARDFDHPNVDAQECAHLVHHLFHGLTRREWIMLGQSHSARTPGEP